MEYSGLTPGEHRFRVRAIDLAGNHEQPPVTDTFEIGIGPAPETTILTGPAATVPDDWASFEFSSSQANSTFECAIDAEPFEECFNPTQYTELEPGQHTFRVRAINSALVPDPSPATWTWQYVPPVATPETTIVTTPPNPQLTLNAVFQFSSSGGLEIEFECALDAEPFESCESPYLIEELPPGEHVFLVRAVDLFLGTTDPTPAEYRWRSIAPPLEPTIDSAPPEPSVGNSHTFTFSSTEPNATFRCRITPNPFHINTFEPCASPHTYTGLPDGEYLFEVLAVNEFGVVGEIPAEHSFEVANPPDTTIVGGPSGTVEAGTIAFAFTSSEQAGATFECSIDGEAFVECLSPAVYPDTEQGLPEIGIGTHTFRVQAIDINDNIDPTPAERTFTVVAAIAPETQIVAGPDATTSSTTASFGFSSEPGATFECSLDGAAFAACPSPPVFNNLSVGNHELRVAAKDVDGHVDPTPAVYTWTVTEPDTVDPETTIGSGSVPPDPTNHTDATFIFSSNEAGSRFQCSLDGAAYEPCSSAKVYTNLAAGQHTFAVAAIDPSNNVDDTAASHTWTIDRAAPETEITSRPSDPSRGDFVSFGLAGSDDVSGAAAIDFECRLDAGAWVDCDDPKSYANLTAGPHTFSARAIDAAGNVDQSPASYGWTVDTAAPETTISNGPPTISTSTSASFTFASEAGVTYECSLDNAPYSSCTSPAEYTGLTPGEHTLKVRATDAAGNVDQSPATHSWTVDLAPDTTIDDGPAATTARTSATFVFSSNEPGATFQCSLDSGSFSSCSSPVTYTSLGEGAHTFRVRATDSVGNVDPVEASYTWTITPPPDTTIDSQPDEQTESTSATFTFSSNQGGVTFRCALDTAEPEPCTSPVTYNNLTPGAHEFLVEAVGPEGNVDPSPAEFGWEIGDLTPPVVSINATPDDPTERTTPSRFEFSVDDPQAALQCSLDGGPLQSCTSPKEYSNLLAGEHTLEVTAVKQHLLVDVTPVEHTWTVVDTIAPETTVASGPAAEIVLGTVATFGFTSNETDATFECSLNGEAFGDCPVPAEFNLEGGAYTLEVRAVDPSGNFDATPATYSFAVLGEPTTTISSAPEATTFDTSATFVFAADQAGATYVCSLDGAPFTTCSSPKTYTDLTYAEHTFSVQATSRFGFVEAAPVTHEWTIEVPPDTTAPETTIDGPAASTGSSVATFRFSGTDNVTPASQLTFECSLDGGAFEPCTSPHVENVTVGAHTFAVQAVDLAGNVDATPATHSWTVVAPDTTLVSGPPATTATATATFHFSSDDPNATFECSLDGGASWSGCESPHAVENLVPGAYELHVRAVNADGTADPTPVTYAWTVVAPDTTITSAPPASSLNTTADFRFASTDLAASFECALDGNPFGDCDSHYVLEAMTVGTHTLLVRAVSTADTVDATPASHTWTVEGPSTTITSGPPASTHNVNALFTFESNDPLATFECALDGATYGSCETPYQLTGVAAGDHELSVRAINSVGGAGTPATRAWTVLAPPDTTLLTFPEDLSEETTATFTFSSDQSGVTFQCALDEAVDDLVFVPCSSPQTYTDLIFGEHDFAVRAIDAEGNFDPTPAEYSWRVGGPAPPVTIDAQPAARTDSRSATFEFSANGRDLRFECALDLGAWTLCDSPKTYNNLTLAPHTFQVRVFSPEAVTEPPITTYNWSVVEFDPPETTIVFGPPSTSDSTTASFAFESDEPAATFQCSLDGAPYSACPVPSDITGLTNGSHTLLVRAIDAYENVDATPASYTWVVDADLTPPVTTFISGPDTPTTTVVDAAFSFVSEPGATFECSFDGEPFAACTSPVEFSELPLGDHTFRVRATDQEGNVESPVTYAWTIVPDTTAPETTLHSGPESPTEATDATFVFSSNELEAEFECSLDGEAFGGCETPDVYQDLTVGTHTYEVRAIDLAGNVDETPASHTWTVVTPPDTTDPQTTILIGPNAQTTIDTIASFTFMSNEPESTFECALDNEPLAECESPEEYADLAPGNHTFRVVATDLAGNTDETPATYAWTVVADPETTITAAPPATAPSASATFQFSSDQAGVTFFCSLDGLEATVCSSPKTYTGLPDGEHTFEVTARNSLGAVDETPAEHIWTVAVPPETTITARPRQPDHVHERLVQLHRHRRRPDVRVLARQRGVRRVRHAGALQRPVGRLAHVRGPRRRRGGQHRSDAGPVHLDRQRRHAARDHDRRRLARGDDQQRQRHVQLHRERGGLHLRLLDRQPAVLHLHVTEDVHGPRGGPARLPRPGDGCRRQHRPVAGDLQLEHRHRRPGHHHRPGRAPRDDPEHERDVQLLRQRAGLDVRVLARQRAVRRLHVAEGLHRPLVRPAHVPRAGDRRGRQRGRLAREPLVDDRAELPDRHVHRLRLRGRLDRPEQPGHEQGRRLDPQGPVQGPEQQRPLARPVQQPGAPGRLCRQDRHAAPVRELLPRGPDDPGAATRRRLERDQRDLEQPAGRGGHARERAVAQQHRLPRGGRPLAAPGDLRLGRQQRLPDPRLGREPGRRAAVPQPREGLRAAAAGGHVRRARQHAARDDDRLRAAGRDAGHERVDRLLVEPGVLHLRVLTRQRRLHRLHVAQAAQRPHGRRAQPPRPRDRPGRQRRPDAGAAHLARDRRHRRAGDHARRGLARVADHEQERDLHVLRHRQRHRAAELRVLARRWHVPAMRVAEGLLGPPARRAQLPRPREGRRGQRRRLAGHPPLDDQRPAAGLHRAVRDRGRRSRRLGAAERAHEQLR